MSSATPPASRSSDRCFIGIPKWFWSSLVAPCLVGALLALGAWAWSLQTVNAYQSETLVNHGVRLEASETHIRDLRESTQRQLERLETKIDRLLERGNL